MTETGRPHSWSIRVWVAMAVVILLGATLRMYQLSFQSLWFDELFSVIFSHPNVSLADIVETYTQLIHDHPLGYPVMLHGWMVIFGDGEIAARSLSVICGVAGIAVVFLVGRRIGGTTLGLIAALLTSVNAFHIAYSQEARSYALVFVVAALSYGALVALVENPTWRTALVYGTTVGVAIHIHYWALVMFFGQIVAASFVMLLRRVRLRDWWPLLMAMGVVAIALVPWIGPLLRVAQVDSHWTPAPKVLFFTGYFHTYFGKNLVLSLGMGGLLLALPWFLRPAAADDDDCRLGSLRTAALVLSVSVAISLASAYVRSLLMVPMLNARFTFVLLPAFLLLVAIALTRLRPPALRTGLTAVLVLVSLANLVISEYYSRPRKEQWREAVAWVLTDPRFDPSKDRGLAIYSRGFQYYVDRQIVDFRFEEATTEILRGLLDEDPKPPAIWLLRGRSFKPSEEFSALLRRSYVRTDRSGFIKTRVERWERKPQ